MPQYLREHNPHVLKVAKIGFLNSQSQQLHKENETSFFAETVMKVSLFLFFIVVLPCVAQDYRKPTYSKYDYTYSTSGDPFPYEIKGQLSIEVNGKTVCEYQLKSGKNFNYSGKSLHTEYEERCPNLRFSFLTMWEPYTKRGISRLWVCSYGWGSSNGYVFRFMKTSCPDVVVALSVGAWLDELNFGQNGFEPDDFDNVPAAWTWYNLNTLENNPEFAERVKYRAARGLIYKVEE